MLDMLLSNTLPTTLTEYTRFGVTQFILMTAPSRTVDSNDMVKDNRTGQNPAKPACYEKQGKAQNKEGANKEFIHIRSQSSDKESPHKGTDGDISTARPGPP